MKSQLPIVTDSRNAIMTDMQDFREIITNRLAELGWSSYRLAEACRAKGVSRDMVYRFLRCEQQANTGAVQVMFDVLGLKVTKGAKPTKIPTRHKAD